MIRDRTQGRFETMIIRIRDRSKYAALALPLLSAVGLVAFGTGYRASTAMQNDGSAWLVKGRTVAHVNGETRRADADVAKDLATGKQGLEVVQTRSGDVFVVNDDTGEVTRIDTGTMTPAQKRQESGKDESGKDKVDVLSTGESTYLIDRQHSKVQEVDPKTLMTERTVDVPGRIDDAAVDDAGNCWVLDGKRGRLQRIVDGQGAGEVAVGSGRGMRLTLVGGHPVVVEPTSGQVVRVDGNHAVPAAHLPVSLGRQVEVNAPTAAGSTAWLAVRSRGELVSVDVDTGRWRPLSLNVTEGADLGPPVAAFGRVYVPDYTDRLVLVVDASSMKRLQDVEVPGHSPQFQLFLRNGKVWANDPYDQKGRVIGSDGRAAPIDKGPGHGVQDGDAPSRTAPPTTERHPNEAPTTPSPSKQPEANPQPSTTSSSTTSSTVVSRPPAAGPRMVEVPDVVGRDMKQACPILVQAGLSCDLMEVPPQPGAVPGQVVATNPPAHTQVRPGRLISVQYFGKSTVPGVVGQSVASACQPITQSKLSCRQVDRGAAPPGQPTGVVVAQQPSAGTVVVSGTEVTVESYGGRAVPPVVGMSRDQACAVLQSPDYSLGCQPVVARAPSQANVVNTQQPAAGAVVTPGTPVQVSYDPDGISPLYRLKRLHTNVWVITSDEQHYQNLKAGTSGYTYIDEGVIGRAYAPTVPDAADLSPLWSYHCNPPDDGHIGPIIYYTNVQSPPGLSSCKLQAGLAALVYNQQYPGTIPLYRMIKRHDGTVDYSYITDRDMNYYLTRPEPWSVDVVLGYVWPPP
jgi:hypothetical protein